MDGTYPIGGGAGNPGGVGAGSGVWGPTGATGTGGLIIIFVMGNVTIGSAGQIVSAGSGNSGILGGASGGASGGGIIYLAYKGTLSNEGTVSAPGGVNGHSDYTGGNGGAGNCQLVNLNTIS